MGHNMKESGICNQVSDMVEAIKFGAMVAYMRATGKMIRLMVEEDLYTLMEIFTMVSGKMTKPMALVNTLILTVPSMKATGLMINNMVKERKNGQMVRNMKEIINSVKKMALENSYGLTDHHTKGTF